MKSGTWTLQTKSGSEETDTEINPMSYFRYLNPTKAQNQILNIC